MSKPKTPAPPVHRASSRPCTHDASELYDCSLATAQELERTRALLNALLDGFFEDDSQTSLCMSVFQVLVERALDHANSLVGFIQTQAWEAQS
jgi:hypothetical protein